MINIFLFSHSTNPESIRKMEQEIPNLYSKKIAYIPTATRGYGYNFHSEFSRSRDFITKNFTNYKIISLDSRKYAAENQKELTKVLHEKLFDFDILFFGGGLPGYLKYWMDRHNFSKFLPEYLKRGGIYIGSSASSMVIAESFSCTELESNGEIEFGAANFKGFGFVKGEIWPHYQDSHELELENFEKENNLKITRLKDGEGIYLNC